MQNSDEPIEIINLPERFEYEPSGTDIFKSWCEENEVYYYAKPAESFSVFQALSITKSKGLKKVILDNLS